MHLLNTTWLYRKIALTLCAITLFCTYYYYKDGQLENYKALQRIEQQLDIIQKTTAISHSIEPIRRYSSYNFLQLNSCIINCIMFRLLETTRVKTIAHDF